MVPNRKHHCHVCGKARTQATFLHSFPIPVQRLQQWVRILNIPELLEQKTVRNYRICGDHFTREQYYNYVRRILKPNAVPFNGNTPEEDFMPETTDFNHQFEQAAKATEYSMTEAASSPQLVEPVLTMESLASSDPLRWNRHKCCLCGKTRDEVRQLHYFPKSNQKLQQWLGILDNAALNELKSIRGYRICNQHFNRGQYFRPGGRLTPRAVPMKWTTEENITFSSVEPEKHCIAFSTEVVDAAAGLVEPAQEDDAASSIDFLDAAAGLVEPAQEHDATSAIEVVDPVGNMNAEKIKTMIENAKEPLLFHNLLDWKLLDWDLVKWKECLGDTHLQCRIGYKASSDFPQWEKSSKIVNGTFDNLTKLEDKDRWFYFDYKYLNQWFIDKFDLREDISWEKFGYKNINADESTIWIGSEGAHTPCHVDTYGFNLIAQISGRKMWLLFPPNSDLKPTRVPYEESTIYSSINFYSPPKSMIDYMLNAPIQCKKLILEPGQVLFVPNGWWHYVENLDLSISINTWIPMVDDNNRRINEALVLWMVKMMTNELQSDERNAIINNPEDFEELSITESLNLVENALTNYNKHEKGNATEIAETSIDLSCFEEKITKIVDLRQEELGNFLHIQRDRFALKQFIMANNECNFGRNKSYLSVLTDPEVIALMKRKLLHAQGNADGAAH